MEKSSKSVAIWIGIGVLMLVIMVALGGITRLTGSGLSITEWNVITGTIPPLNEGDWMKEFTKYKQTPQFQLLNFEFTLSDFKFIYFWEWFHRFWGRLIGIVFIAGFIYLFAKGYLKKNVAGPLVVLFVLGAMQGAVGWIMVMSGLTGDAVYVKPTRLALHFIFAMVLIAYAFWFFLKLVVAEKNRLVSGNARAFITTLLVMVTVQLIFGALMAGHKAATAAPTWPDINGSMLPRSAFPNSPFLINLVENKITIHFVHRTLAYIILITTLIFSWYAGRLNKSSPTFNIFKALTFLLVITQVVLGIFSLIVSPAIVPNRWGTFEWLALSHQLVGMLFALSIVGLLFTVRRN
jgi:cytochrome c oxidase assembly protein subunit 15